ncbi:MAG: carboxylating nicotinate-nucleotide diphosphorylase [Pseudomonadota bacterium]
MIEDIREAVIRALAEDIGDGDVTADLIRATETADARVITRQDMTMAGKPWFDQVMRQVDANIETIWHYDDGDDVMAGETLCEMHGSARSILTAERTALNFLQLLSATATLTADYVRAIENTGCQILDTRKTIPGLRTAQKYAVTCGGGVNHRIGLFDAILIKENHIASARGITHAVAAARRTHAGMPIEVEAESLDELRQALAARADQVLLDNFSLDELRDAVAINQDQGNPPAKLEASGNVTLSTIRQIAETGVDFISVGALTKNIKAVDLSMLFGTDDAP